ncbi:MAG: type II toxin-antitoxin system RelE/ParE family toxin [Patescibacteria group bacterium]
MKINFLFSKTYDFLMELDDISVGKINNSLGLLEKYGNTISYPHTKPLGGGAFELRVIGRKSIRIFFIFKNNEAYILHAIMKKTEKLSRKDIDYVLRLKKELR